MNKSTRGLLIALAVIAAGLLIFLPAISQTTYAGGGPADGAALYKAKCAACHSPDGSGTSPMGKKLGVRDLGSADVQKQSDAELAKITSDGKNKMPAFKGKLSDEEIAALVKHIRTFKNS
jgi:mono/diheme cytochrome c family protein